MTSANPSPHILLVGNYRPDQQMSMLRYSDMLFRELTLRQLEVEMIEPKAFFGRISLGPFTKWLRYVDKYLLFPIRLHQKLSSVSNNGIKVVLHITDHSNAIYLNKLRHIPTVVTCHDLLAVRGALGEDTDCPASKFGKFLQTRILAGLRKATHVICVSQATRGDLSRLAPEVNSSVIPLPLNQPFKVLPENEVYRRLHPSWPHLLTTHYILHVGSSLSRKNREGILRIFHLIQDRFDGMLVFAGEKLSKSQKQLASELGLTSRILEIESPTGLQIEALYNRAYAFLFPSKTEGFGWPIIEAQACGCPVLVARTTSLPEVVGEGGFIRDLADEAGFAEDLLALESESTRQMLVQRGLENLTRFDTRKIIDQYVACYSSL